MDQPGLDPVLHRQALDGLRRVNSLSGTAQFFWRPIRSLSRTLGNKEIRVLDIASGGGDVAIALAKIANASGVPLIVDGCDISTVAVSHAQAAARRKKLENVRFFEFDILGSDDLPTYDVVVCSLFLHHLDGDGSLCLLRQMYQAARHLVLLSDLRRSRFAYWLAWTICRIVSRSHVVHIDGPLSVEAAYTIPEVLALAEQAGVDIVTVARSWPQRFLMTARKQ